MLKLASILFRSLVLGGLLSSLLACGQKGGLYLPQEAAAQNRATLPQTIQPDVLKRSTPGSPAPDAATATPTPVPSPVPSN